MTDSARAAYKASRLPASPERTEAEPGSHDVERVRLLYRGSRIPNLLLLLTSLACVLLLWPDAGTGRLGVWALWMVSLALVWLQQASAFDQAG
ncbi:MAG: hypothetical protein IE926_17510, partial [Micrococcales bacterium]|nr:hypothetical protein [Micrococcales bacterium]